MLQIVVGLFETYDGILLGKRKFRKSKPYCGYIDLPGGRVEPGESLDEAIKREWHEETNLKIKIMSLVEKWDYTGNKRNAKDAQIHLYRIEECEGEISFTSDISGLIFVPKQQMKDLKLTPWTRHFLREYLK